jgi:N-sulfoglucosamine sulfohydrolase
MKTIWLLPFLCLGLLSTGCHRESGTLPNILWITSEDNMPMLGCYGDEFATTPNLDRLANEGFRYTHAYANAPVCAPGRTTILTGVLACSNGNEQMRSYYSKSPLVIPYPEYLRGMGYYCTNNSKTDYNYAGAEPDKIWDECSGKAHYRNRAPGQPFFAVFNITVSHESSIHVSTPDSLLRHRPEDVPLPPYHPATPEMKHDWAQYYDRVEDMDTRVGELLRELEEEGLAGNTIVFYYSDHGGVLGRSKRYLYETGTHVPMIVRIPEKYRRLYPGKAPGSEVGRLVSFVDLAPTLLSLAGIRPPETMQGSAFLGKFKGPEPEYVYMFRDRMDERYDMSRSITDGEYRYIRNFNPEKIYMQHLIYLWKAPSMRSWEKAFREGKCNEVQARWWKSKPAEELYHTATDPWEIHNLAGDPAFVQRLESMRKASMELADSLKDAGFIPEAQRNARTGELAAYDYLRSGKVPLEDILQMAYAASAMDTSNLEMLLQGLDHPDAAVRYWAVTGLMLLGERSRPYLENINEAATDPSWDVRVKAAELLYLLGEKDPAEEVLKKVLACDRVMARTHALNCIDFLDAGPEEFLSPCLDMLERSGRTDDYDGRMMQWLMEKWHIDPGQYGITF